MIIRSLIKFCVKAKSLRKFSTQSVMAQNSYSNQISQVHQACKHINALPHEVLERSCLIVMDKFFPLRNNSERIIPLLAQVVHEHETKLIQYPLFSNLINTEGTYSAAELIYEYILVLVDYLDKGNFGFLTGDIHPYTFNILQKVIEDRPQDDAGIYEGLRQQIFNVGKTYKLPLYGIKHPNSENPRNLFERQLLLEDESNEIAIGKFNQVFEELHNMHMSHNLRVAQKCIVDWFPALCQLIQKEQQVCLTNQEASHAPILCSIKSEKLAIIALSELMKLLIGLSINQKETELMFNQLKSTALYNAICLAINKQYVFDEEEKELLKAAPEDGDYKAFQKNRKYQETKLKEKIQNNYLYISKSRHNLSKEILMQISSLLVYFMLESIKFKNEHNFLVPLLVQSYRMSKSKKLVSVLNVDQQFLQKLMIDISKDNSFFLHLDRSIPMIYPPAKWVDYEIGGYYQRPTNLIRVQDAGEIEGYIKFADLTELYGILDRIGRVPWKINSKVLDVVTKVWDEGGGLAMIPKRNVNLQNYVYEHQIKDCKTLEEKYKLYKKIQQQRDVYSLQCDFSLKLSNKSFLLINLDVANSFNGIQQIYFPHNMDFRGRLYPIPPHLNHMGADLSRGLLIFAEGKPLGVSGLRWLKIHVANKMGKDKLTLAEREQYVDSNIDLIVKCAENPMVNREWSEFEDAWQSLAAMLDYVQALKSKDPLKYVSNLHIHQDGSCNGLQHYAALGRDIEGATQVNLSDAEKPGDVYSHVAGMVERTIETDSKNPEAKYHHLAVKLLGHIKRKIVKQTVMTSVYGVTFIGAREQIHRQLKDKQILAEDDQQQYEASFYLASTTLEAIKDLFSGAHKIKQWLIQCATIISNLDQPVSWITPLGLPVVQPYRSVNKYDSVKTVMQQINIQANSQNLPINKPKQRSAFPPNFIHSLDSTHMLYTSQECYKAGLTFAAVHDSYWTHASSIDQLNTLLREQFVRLHSQPLLEKLRESFQIRYPQARFPSIPERGDFDLEKVKKSIYFFA